jgi:hypothetical protein
MDGILYLMLKGGLHRHYTQEYLREDKISQLRFASPYMAIVVRSERRGAQFAFKGCNVGKFAKTGFLRFNRITMDNIVDHLVGEDYVVQNDEAAGSALHRF